MSTTIEEILSTPSQKKQTEHSLIISMSKDISRGFGDLKNAVSGGGATKLTKKQQKWAFMVHGQITPNAENREDSRKDKRKSPKILP